jgi:peptide/nickel transport system permease protein
MSISPAEPALKAESLLGAAVRGVAGHPGVAAGVFICAAMAAAAAFAPWLSLHDPYAQNIVDRLTPPDATYLLGTDSFGRDVLSRIVWGSRISLVVAFLSTVLAVLVGGSVGLASGYVGGRTDAVIMRAMDVLLSFPSLILGLAVVALLGPEMRNLVLAIALTAVAPFARIARAPVLSLKERAYIEAARALGFTHVRILLVHILPNVMSEILVMATLWMATAVRTEASLAFIGLGVKPPIATWGGMMREGFDNILDAPWLSVFPGCAILALVLALNLMGDGLRDATDPLLDGY